jgi:crossover junction endodeoxyribonuclease RusA
MKLLSLNDRLHWRERYRRGDAIRKAAWALAVQAKIPPLARIAVVGEYQPPDRRKRDEDNLTISIKSAIDGIKASGCIPDDSSEHVRYDGCRIGERYPKGRLIITVTELGP